MTEPSYQNTDLDLEPIESEDDDLEIDDAPYEIRTVGADLTIEILSQKLGSKEILIPDFQRQYVWPVKKASKLIESFLLGLPVPQVFLYQETRNRDLLVVDGQQRLLSAHFFLRGTLADETTQFRLRGVKQKWEGKTFEELDETDKRRLKNYILRSTIFEQINPSDNKSVYEIFERLNTGGMALTEQEVRNCVNRGPINSFLDRLNNIDSWRSLLGKPEPDKRMKDLELILRVLALIKNWSEYKKPMKDFISEFMEKYTNISQPDQEHFYQIFKGASDKIFDASGRDAFRLSAGRINITILDSVMTAVALKSEEATVDLNAKILALKANPGYGEYISHSTTDEDVVKGRIKIAIENL